MLYMLGDASYKSSFNKIWEYKDLFVLSRTDLDPDRLRSTRKIGTSVKMTVLTLH